MPGTLRQLLRERIAAEVDMPKHSLRACGNLKIESRG